MRPIDETLRLIYAQAGRKAGAPVARRSWIRTLEQIRRLPEIVKPA